MKLIVIDGWEYRLTSFEEFKSDCERFGVSLNAYYCVVDTYKDLSTVRPLTEEEQKELEEIEAYYTRYLHECAEDAIEELNISLHDNH